MRSLEMRILLARLLRKYPVSLRGRTRIISTVHPLLFNKYEEVMTPLKLGKVPFNVDLTEKAQMSMFYYAYEPYEVAFLKRMLKQGQFFVDAGANIGYYSSIALSIAGRNGTVVAFEPMPLLAARLKTFAEKAQEDGWNMLAEQKALSEKAGEARLHVSKGSNIGWCTIIESLMPQEDIKETYSVETVRLDDFLDEKGLGIPDVIKIDVEGAESMVLKGMSRIFEKAYFPALMIEPRVESWNSVHSILAPFGYKPFRCEKRGLLTAFNSFDEAKCHLAIWLRNTSF